MRLIRRILCWLGWRQPPEPEPEWEEYPEPLFDPLEFEVSLLVKEYFEQADAEAARRDTDECD